MRRREFITLLGGAAAWPFAARAQQGGPMRRIGALLNSAATDTVAQAYLTTFLQSLRQLGWIDGQNLRLDLRWNASDAELSRIYTAQLIGLTPDVILAASTTNLTALRQATSTVPIVFVQVSDPVAQGFVENLAHPTGNITGFSSYEFSIGGKWLDLLKQIVPSLTRVAVIFNPEISPQSKFFLRSVEAAAPSFGVQIMTAPVHKTADIEPAVGGFSGANSALIFPTDSFIALRRDLIVQLAAQYRLPAIYPLREFVTAGGLMRYGIDYDDHYRQAASYVDRILKGAKPGDLPIQQPTKFSLIINLKAAKGLGLTVPPNLLARADEVIE